MGSFRPRGRVRSDSENIVPYNEDLFFKRVVAPMMGDRTIILRAIKYLRNDIGNGICLSSDDMTPWLRVNDIGKCMRAMYYQVSGATQTWALRAARREQAVLLAARRALIYAYAHDDAGNPRKDIRVETFAPELTTQDPILHLRLFHMRGQPDIILSPGYDSDLPQTRFGITFSPYRSTYFPYLGRQDTASMSDMEMVHIRHSLLGPTYKLHYSCDIHYRVKRSDAEWSLFYEHPNELHRRVVIVVFDRSNHAIEYTDIDDEETGLNLLEDTLYNALTVNTPPRATALTNGECAGCPFNAICPERRVVIGEDANRSLFDRDGSPFKAWQAASFARAKRDGL